MRKTITLIALMFVFAITASAQAEWKKGQDVTTELEWSDYSGQENTGAWQGGGGANFAYSFQEWEMFNNAKGAEFFQIFHLPAGVYTFKVQAFYRGSYNPAYWEGKEQINAEFFGESVNLDEETGEVTEVTRSQAVKVASIASSENSEGRLFTTTEWTNDVEYAYGGVSYYVPNCMEGTRAYFDAGYYDTNELRVVQTEDGYIKIGLRKTDTLNSDWLIFTNFRATYDNDAGEAILVLLAEEDFKKALEEVYQYSQRTASAYPALQAYLEEAFSDLDDKYSGASTIDEYTEGTEALYALLDEYKGYYNNARALTTMIKLSEETLNGTDFSGKAAFMAAIDAAKKVEGAEYGDGNTTSAADYSAAFNALAAARADYAISKGQMEDGSYDFTTIIAYPFFVNTEYNPTWDEVENRWVYPDEIYNGNGELQGWNDLGESGDGDNKTYITTTRIRMASDVTIGSDTTSVYSWYQTNTSGYEPYWNHKMTSAKQWSTPGARREIVQNLIGLPKGYYSAKGRGITWSNDWSADSPADLGIYIQSNGVRAESQEQVRLSGWWNYSYDDWSDFSTEMIQVTDGTARVAFHANGFSSFTGMQLYYYGEEPDFTKMIQVKIDAMNEAIDELVLSGDKAAVREILSTISTPITGFDAYSAANATLTEANNYINEANAYLENNDATLMFANLVDQYEEGSDRAEILSTAILHTFDIYDAETTTYKDVASCIDDYNAYVHYFDVVDKYASIDNLDLNNKINEQTNALKIDYADAQKLASYEAELAAIYNKAVMADLNMESATENNPVDVTILITNPTFAEGQTGWMGSFTTDNELQNSEAYNRNFRVEQTIYSLPAGYYRVDVKSFYRDGGFSAAYDHIWYMESGEFTPNVKLFANGATTDVVSLCNEDAQFTERSFTEYTFMAQNDVEEEIKWVELRAWMTEEESEDDNGNITYTVTSWRQQLDENGEISDEDKDNGDAWIYDSWATEGTDRYFYPNSMRGAGARFANDGGAYNNSVVTKVAEGGSLNFGLFKDNTIDSDWCMFDDFKLYYLGTTAPVGVGSIINNNAKAVEYYTIDGRRISSPMKGINIVRMSDGTTKKILF